MKYPKERNKKTFHNWTQEAGEGEYHCSWHSTVVSHLDHEREVRHGRRVHCTSYGRFKGQMIKLSPCNGIHKTYLMIICTMTQSCSLGSILSKLCRSWLFFSFWSNKGYLKWLEKVLRLALCNPTNVQHCYHSHWQLLNHISLLNWILVSTKQVLATWGDSLNGSILYTPAQGPIIRDSCGMTPENITFLCGGNRREHKRKTGLATGQ